jgi:hypothetical protein
MVGKLARGRRSRNSPQTASHKRYKNEKAGKAGIFAGKKMTV